MIIARATRRPGRSPAISGRGRGRRRVAADVVRGTGVGSPSPKLRAPWPSLMAVGRNDDQGPEDLNHGQVILGVRVVNPLLESGLSPTKP